MLVKQETRVRFPMSSFSLLFLFSAKVRVSINLAKKSMVSPIQKIQDQETETGLEQLRRVNFGVVNKKNDT